MRDYVVAKKLTIKEKIDRKFKNEVFRTLYKCFSILPIQKNKIVMLSDSKKTLSDNFKFVYDELQRRENYRYYFLLKESVTKRKRYLEIIRLAYEMARAKVIMIDDFYPMVYPLKIRKKAELIQLWHAVGAFKKFGFSRLGKPGGPSANSVAHRNYTKVIVSSQYVAPFYAEGFGIELQHVIATGIPRTDVFFDASYKEEKRQQVYMKYPQLQGKKVILYAPTFRGNGQSSAKFPQKKLDLQQIYEGLGEDEIFAIKMHPFVKKNFIIPAHYSNRIINVTSYPSVNNLLFVTDILITDYSSVCFEYALLNKPMIFYCFDLEKYIHARDFYIPYEEFTPGTLVETSEQLLAEIKRALNNPQVDYTDFKEKFFDELDGQSTERVADLVISCMKQGNIRRVKNNETHSFYVSK